MSLKRPVPVTSCTECGNAGYNATLINLRCGKNVNGERCREQIRARSTIRTGKNAYLVTGSEPNATQLALSVEERVGFLPEAESKRASYDVPLITRCFSFFLIHWLNSRNTSSSFKLPCSALKVHHALVSPHQMLLE